MQGSIPIYGINFKDNPQNARKWLQDQGNPYRQIGMDTNGVLETTLGIYGLPETFLIDKKGVIRYHFQGTLSMQAWQNTLLPLIRQLSREK